MLPERYSLRNGFVFFPDDRTASQQGDILIVDETKPGAYYFREGNFAVVDPSGIVAAIEVKTRLNKSTFADSIRCLSSFQHLVQGSVHVTPTFLFAYESATFSPQRLAEWYRAIELPRVTFSPPAGTPTDLPFYPMSLLALNRGMIAFRNVNTNNWGHYVSLGEEGRGPKIKNLSVFLATIRKFVLSSAGVEVNPFMLAVTEGMTWSRQLLRFGDGLMEPD